MDEKRDNIEVRLHKDGTLDEVLIFDPRSDRCLFHMEQMDDHWFWMRLYGFTQDLVVHVGAEIGEVKGRTLTDERGYVTGHEKLEGPKVYTSFEWEESTIESDCDPAFQTPEKDRLAEVAELVNKYGADLLFETLAKIVRKKEDLV